MRYIIVLAIMFISVQSFAQDTHYWTYRYGTRAVLMGGPAVGGLEDNSSVIYNPALLSLVKSTSVSINSNVYQIVNITAKDGAGPNQDVISNQFSAVPVTLSGMIRKKKPSRLTMGYAIIVPSEFTFKATARQDAPTNIVDDIESPGDEEYVGQFTINTRLSENQGAFALAYKISDKFSIGLTNQFIYRSHSFTKSELTRMILNNAGKTLVTTNESQSIEYTNLRYTAKIGLAFVSGGWSAGATVVLPSIGIGGKGTITRDIAASNLQINVAARPTDPPILTRISQFSNPAINSRQSDLTTTYNSPLSIAVGVAYKNPKWLMAASAEWFGNIALYNIMSPSNDLFVRPSTFPIDGAKFLQVNAANKEVINFAIGLERSLNDKISISTGFRTNQSFYDKTFDQRITNRFGRTINNNALNLDISSWDIYHIVLGGTFKQERRDLSIGVTYSWASDGNIRQFANFDKPTENTFLLGEKLKTTASYYSFGVLLGYTLRIRTED